MSGITAASASVTLASGATSADNTSTGWVVGERITLATSPTGTNYSWGQASPAASAVARSALSSSTDAAPTFTPDVGGTYVVTCTVDGTDYVLRFTVQAASIADSIEALRLSPRVDTTVPAPATGVCLYYSATHSALVVKDANNVVKPVTLGSAY